MCRLQLSGALEQLEPRIPAAMVREVAASCDSDVYFNTVEVRYNCGDRRSEVQFKSVAQVIDGFLFGSPLVGNIYLGALSDVPFALLARREL